MRLHPRVATLSLATTLLVPLLLSIGPADPVISQTSSYELRRGVFSGGGKPCWDGDRWTVGTAGQPSPIGITAGRTTLLHSGFWWPGHHATSAPSVPVLVDRLEQNIPNPFNPSTRIDYSLAEAQLVSIEVINLQGRTVAVLVHETKPAGSHHVMWHGRDEQGHEVASGVYFYRFEAGPYRDVKRMLLLK